MLEPETSTSSCTPPESVVPSESLVGDVSPGVHGLSRSPSMSSLASNESEGNEDSLSRPITPFHEILKQIIPEEFVGERNKSKPLSIRKRLQKARKSGWVVLKRVLEVVKEVSSLCEPLEMALGLLLELSKLLEVSNIIVSFLRVDDISWSRK
jgi:hypothetical protein